jgi:hypothetical protein
MVLGGAESLRYDSRWQQHMATAPLSSPNAPGTPRTARPETGRSADARPPTATRLAVLHRQALAPGYSQGHNTSTMGKNTTAGIPRSRGLVQYSFREEYLVPRLVADTQVEMVHDSADQIDGLRPINHTHGRSRMVRPNPHSCTHALFNTLYRASFSLLLFISEFLKLV